MSKPEVLTLTWGKDYVEVDPESVSWRRATYAIGDSPPRYQVPAIRQGFEWGRRLGAYNPGTDLFTDYVVLIHWEQGVVDA